MRSARAAYVVGLFLVLFCSSASARGAWYSGGTLHDAKMSEWSSASYANRLATSADFVTKLMLHDGRTIPPVDDLKPRAEAMEACISRANKGGVADNQHVATIGATCWVLMKGR